MVASLHRKARPTCPTCPAGQKIRNHEPVIGCQRCYPENPGFQYRRRLLWNLHHPYGLEHSPSEYDRLSGSTKNMNIFESRRYRRINMQANCRLSMHQRVANKLSEVTSICYSVSCRLHINVNYSERRFHSIIRR